MKKISSLLALLFILSACSSDADPNPEPQPVPVGSTEGTQAFRIALNEISAKQNAASTRKSQDPAFAYLSIEGQNGVEVLTRAKFALAQSGDGYVTAGIPLEAGAYTLVEFIAVDADDRVVSMAPLQNSVLSQFTGNPLPLNFAVTADENRVTSTENIDAAGYASVDFGYSELEYEFSENTDSFTLTVDDTSLRTEKTLVLKSITGSSYVVDWGDGTSEAYVSTIPNSNIENSVSHTYAENGAYTITIIGPVEAIELLDFRSDDQNNGFQSHVKAVSLDNLTLLKSCQLYAGSLTTLDTSKNLRLESVGLGYNQVSSLDFSNNPKLKSVWLRYNQLTALDLSGNPDLDFLWVDGNQISSLDLSGNPKLRVVLARENNLTAIDFSNNPELERFDVSDNAISNLDIGANTRLTEINVGRNALNGIELSNNTNLVRADLYQNQIAAIDLTANTQLRDLYIDNNLLTAIDLSANAALERLIIEYNNLNNLNLAANPKIFDLQIGGNQFTGLQLDEIISGIYDQAVLNAVMNGYIDYKNNPGFNTIDPSTISKLNELQATFGWAFNNN